MPATELTDRNLFKFGEYKGMRLLTNLEDLSLSLRDQRKPLCAGFYQSVRRSILRLARYRALPLSYNLNSW
jgi:hypothetical protein